MTDDLCFLFFLSKLFFNGILRGIKINILEVTLLCGGTGLLNRSERQNDRIMIAEKLYAPSDFFCSFFMWPMLDEYFVL